MTLQLNRDSTLKSFALILRCNSNSHGKSVNFTKMKFKHIHSTDLLNIFQMCPQDKVITQRWAVGTGEGKGWQAGRNKQSRCGPFNYFVCVRALKVGQAAACEGNTAAGCERWRGDLFLLAVKAVFSNSPNSLVTAKASRLCTSRLPSSDHWSSPHLLLILRHVLSLQNQLSPDYFPAPPSLDNRWPQKVLVYKAFSRALTALIMQHCH